MSYCEKCGTQFEDGIKFCTSCGAEQTGAPKATYQQPAPTPTYQQPTPQPKQGGDFQDKMGTTFKNLNNTADNTSNYDKADIEQNKVMAILAYIGILVLVPIFAAPTSKFARFHANQGLVLAVTEIAYYIAYIILTIILSNIPVIGTLISLLLGLAGIVFLVFVIMGIMNAANGKAKELPIIGKFKILK